MAIHALGYEIEETTRGNVQRFKVYTGEDRDYVGAVDCSDGVVFMAHACSPARRLRVRRIVVRAGLATE